MTILIIEGIAKVYRKMGNLAISDQEGNRMTVPVPDLELVVVVGERIQVTSSAVLTLISQGVPIVFFSGRSDTYGVLFDVIQIGSANIREVQYRYFTDSYHRLMYSKPIMYSKIKGLYNVLRYEYKYHKDKLGREDYEYIKYSILEVLEDISRVSSVDELRKREALGSKYFWNAIVNFIPDKYGFTGRVPRGGDVINSAIDFLYAILYGIITKAIVVNGLDPFFGLIHVMKAGRLSLTYDLSEIFKPIVLHTIVQACRRATLRTFRGSRLLKPRTIEILVKYLYYKIARESEKRYKRKTIWYLPIMEARNFKRALVKEINYKPYVYNPTE